MSPPIDLDRMRRLRAALATATPDTLAELAALGGVGSLHPDGPDEAHPALTDAAMTARVLARRAMLEEQRALTTESFRRRGIRVHVTVEFEAGSLRVMFLPDLTQPAMVSMPTRSVFAHGLARSRDDGGLVPQMRRAFGSDRPPVEGVPDTAQEAQDARTAAAEGLSKAVYAWLNDGLTKGLDDDVRGAHQRAIFDMLVLYRQAAAALECPACSVPDPVLVP